MAIELNFEIVDPGEPRRVHRAVVPAKAPTAFASSLARRGTIAHWMVPPPFSNRGLAMSELGVERYMLACEEYYGAILQKNLDAAQLAYARWVVRHCVSSFETLLRRFKRHTTESPENGALVSPLEMYRDARMMVDIELVLRLWQVRNDLRPAMQRLLRAKLEHLWELS